MTGDRAHTVHWDTAQLIEATGGRLVCGKPGQAFAAVAIDSRTAPTDALFVAIQGERHDGHDFIGQVVAAGLKGLLVAEAKRPQLPVAELTRQGMVCIEVADTVQALQDLAAFHRNRTGVKVVAITGSNGKTTTRAMTAAVIGRAHSVLATTGNLNNHIGLPLTLLQVDRRHQWAVVELGMNHAGEILRLGRICRPDIGVITNVQPAHLEGLGSIEGIADAKAELLDTLAPDGCAVLNADDPMFTRLSARTRTPVVAFGEHPHARVRAASVSLEKESIVFDLILDGQATPVRLHSAGRFMVSNALAAAAVGHRLGMAPTQIAAGLESTAPVKGRLNRIDLDNGVHLIDDTYNANPGSMAAALSTLAALKGRGRAVLVAGDMRELGDYSRAEHLRMGALAARLEVARLYATGEFAEDLAAGACGAGMPAAAVTCGDHDVILAALRRDIEPGDWVLVKGSRAMHMESVVEALTQWARRR